MLLSHLLLAWAFQAASSVWAAPGWPPRQDENSDLDPLGLPAHIFHHAAQQSTPRPDPVHYDQRSYSRYRPRDPAPTLEALGNDEDAAPPPGCEVTLVENVRISTGSSLLLLDGRVDAKAQTTLATLTMHLQACTLLLSPGFCTST